MRPPQVAPALVEGREGSAARGSGSQRNSQSADGRGRGRENCRQPHQPPRCLQSGGTSPSLDSTHTALCLLEMAPLLSPLR